MGVRRLRVTPVLLGDVVSLLPPRFKIVGSCRCDWEVILLVEHESFSDGGEIKMLIKDSDEGRLIEITQV